MYLAGYSVECILKALILATVAAGDRGEMLASFRGTKAHDYDWLKSRYFRHGGSPFPSAVAKHFTLVNSWTTDLRYRAGAARMTDAETFLRAARAIMDWADGRL